jgi:hypothetical protein
MTREERSKLSQEDQWRVVTLEKSEKGKLTDWVHAREWRAPGDFKLPGNLLAVLVRTPTEAKELQEIIADNADDFAVKPLSILPLEIVCQGLPYTKRPSRKRVGGRPLSAARRDRLGST